MKPHPRPFSRGGEGCLFGNFLWADSIYNFYLKLGITFSKSLLTYNSISKKFQSKILVRAYKKRIISFLKHTCGPK